MEPWKSVICILDHSDMPTTYRLCLLDDALYKSTFDLISLLCEFCCVSWLSYSYKPVKMLSVCWWCWCYWCLFVVDVCLLMPVSRCQPGAHCIPRPVASGRVICVCDWLSDATGLDSGDRSWICNTA